jgi:hypothetical protein
MLVLMLEHPTFRDYPAFRNNLGSGGSDQLQNGRHACSGKSEAVVAPNIHRKHCRCPIVLSTIFRVYTIDR